MKKILLIATILILAITANAQEIKSDNIQDFSVLSLSGKINVKIEESDHNSVEISLIDSDMSRIVWGCKDGELSIRLKPNANGKGSADIKITYKSLSKIDATGGVSLNSISPIKTGVFTLHASSGSNVSVEMYVSDLTLDSDGNSAVLLKGSANYMTVKATTKGKVDTRDFEAKSVIALAQLNSEMFVWGTEKLDARSTGNSVIYYRGTPEILKVTERTMGSVEQFSF